LSILHNSNSIKVKINEGTIVLGRQIANEGQWFERTIMTMKAIIAIMGPAETLVRMTDLDLGVWIVLVAHQEVGMAVTTITAV
jgi:hypothetical protein